MMGSWEQALKTPGSEGSSATRIVISSFCSLGRTPSGMLFLACFSPGHILSARRCLYGAFVACLLLVQVLNPWDVLWLEQLEASLGQACAFTGNAILLKTFDVFASREFEMAATNVLSFCLDASSIFLFFFVPKTLSLKLMALTLRLSEIKVLGRYITTFIFATRLSSFFFFKLSCFNRPSLNCLLFFAIYKKLAFSAL